jgi:hypothetical protein
MIAATFDGTARFVWSRNRGILVTCTAAYAAIFVACQIWSPEEVHRFLPQTTVFMRMAPFFVPLLALAGSVSMATAQLGSRESFFPRVFYTLPIKAHEMVLPFITYTIVLTTAMWLAGGVISSWRILMLGPPGTPIEAERIAYWLPFLVTSGLVWFQALAWTPVTAGWKRVCAILAATLAHFIVVVLYAGGALSANQVVVGSVLQIPLVFLVASRGVARDRRGASQDGTRTGAAGDTSLAKREAKAAARRPLQQFPGALEAQFWFESRIQRWSGVVVSALPLLLLIIVVVLSALNTRIAHPTLFGAIARIAILMFVWSLIALAAVNGFLYASFRSVTRWQYRDVFAMPAFFAALPMSTGDFVWVKLMSVTTRMLWFSGAAIIGCACIVYITGIIDPANVPVLALPVSAFVLFLLSCTASAMCMSLAGRTWNRSNAIHCTRYVALAIAAALVGAYWGRHHAPPPALPEIVRGIAIVKLVSLTLLARHVARRGLLSAGRLAAILAFAAATFAALLGTALVYLPEGAISVLTLSASLVLLTPVQGTLAAPLALHLNRVR